LTGSIHRVLSVAFLTPQELLSGAGGFAAAIAVGAFFGQIQAIASSASDEDRRKATALGGLGGLLAIIGLILFSISSR
jgi:hypothetical protein